VQTKYVRSKTGTVVPSAVVVSLSTMTRYMLGALPSGMS
jgi:hypothetical protein